MPTSHPLRLEKSLVAAAAREGEIFKRSIPRQIEYWAELGRSVADHVNPIDLIKVREGLATLSIEPVTSTPVRSTEVFGELEGLREAGKLAGLVSSSAIRYQASTKNPGYLEQVHPDGTRIVGRFSSGKFSQKK
ncbi:MAG: hypothetical protein ABIJ09_03000 [Pseudomonadota bacterium]